MEADVIHIACGEEFQVDLAENSTTGYVWRIEPISPGIEVIEATLNVPATAGVGGGGSRRFRLRGISPGVHQLQFQLRRAWEPEPLERRLISVEVQ